MLTARSNADTLNLDFQASSMLRNSPHLWHLKINYLLSPAAEVEAWVRSRLGLPCNLPPCNRHEYYSTRGVKHYPRPRCLYLPCDICLPRGICEATKALDKGQAHLCVLVSDCDRCRYVKVVRHFVLSTRST